MERNEKEVIVEGVSSEGKFRGNFDYVVVTLPLGVLQEGSVKFLPPLSDDKSKAIHGFKMGLVNKIGISFSSKSRLNFQSCASANSSGTKISILYPAFPKIFPSFRS